ncbi:MAG: glycoside hydrolase domain-containing protein [Nocardioides sp.]
MRAPARLRTALGALLVPAVAVTVSVTTLPAQATSPRERTGPEPAAVFARTWAAVHPAVSAAPVSTSARRRQTTASSGGSRWTGYAFDACRAPSSRVMDRWRVASPFLGVGIYIGGALRACPQKHLTRGWVRHQTGQGWRLLPIWVGPQASCTSYRRTISSRPSVARAQGVRAARGARNAATLLGLGRDSTLWYDLEWFQPGNHRCATSAMHFLSAWTEELHRGGYESGVYSSVSAGIAALGRERASTRFTAPDKVWFAWANGRRDVSWRKYVKAPRWKLDRRVHQYALDVRATYGGVRMAIDRNFVDLGSSPAVRRAPAVCGRIADRPIYGRFRTGSTGPRVRVAQCLLRAAGHFEGEVGVAHGKQTRQAVRSFQKHRGLRVTGRTDDRTWTALLATGPRDVLKRGSEGTSVRRLQRALTAALPGVVPVHGHFGPGTTNAVRRYQARTGLRVSGVATPGTWHALRTGAPPQPRHHAKAHSHGKAQSHKPKHPKKRRR